MKILFLILFSQSVFCQSKNDSLFLSTVFQTPSYVSYIQSPGNWFIEPFVKTRKELFNRLDTMFRFVPSDYFGSYNKMYIGNLSPLDSINATLNYYYYINKNYAYKQFNPCFKLPFILNCKPSNAYCIFTPQVADFAKNELAFLIITGSGTNNGGQMVRGEGYQNIYGYLRDSLAQYGDVYIAIRPLIDFRSLVWNGQELNSEFPIPGQITNWLNSSHYGHEGTPYGINSLIESIALGKYLKLKYDKVIITGLSYGGAYTDLNAFESVPDAALISGGYSILYDQTNANNDFEIASFGSLWYSKERDSIKAMISKTQTQFLYSWGKDTGDPVEESESINHNTENYFRGLKNVQYFYNYNKHTFPPMAAYKELLK